MRGCVLAALARPRVLEGVTDASEIKGCPMSKWLDTRSLRLGSGNHDGRSAWVELGNKRMQSEGWAVRGGKFGCEFRISLGKGRL